MKFRKTTARNATAKALQTHFPAGWALVEHEGKVDDNDRVLVRVTQRSIAKSDTGFSGQHLVTCRATIIWPQSSLADAEEAADSDMELFLFALDAAGVDWSDAVKSQFEDENNRLGYSVDITSRTEQSEGD